MKSFLYDLFCAIIFVILMFGYFFYVLWNI